MDQYVTYHNDYHVLICRQHAFGLSADYVERHFRESHKTIPIEIRKKIVHYSKTLDLWQSERVNNIAPTFVPIQGLHIISGLKCDYFDCKELRSTEISMEKHCRDNHGWKGKDGRQWSEQKMQVIFPSLKHKYFTYFEIINLDIFQ